MPESISFLPEEIRVVFDEAEQKIGFERAMIALQGIIHQIEAIRFISGQVRQETIDAFEKAIATCGVEQIVERFITKLKSRFPEEYAPAPDPDPEVESSEEPVIQRTRRVR